MKKESGRPYLAFTASMLIFGTEGIIRRFVPLSPALLTFVCCALGAAAAAAFTVFKKVKGTPRKETAEKAKKSSSQLQKSTAGRKKSTAKAGKNKQKKEPIEPKALCSLILAGICMAISRILLIESYRFTTESTATLCYYTAPAVVILFSPLLLHEPLNAKIGTAAAVSAVGMVLVSGFLEGQIQQYDCRGILFSLGAAVFFAAVILLNKTFSMEDIGKNATVQLTAATLALIPYLLFTNGFGNQHISPGSWVLVAVSGVVHAGLGCLLYFGGMKKLKGQTVALLSYLNPVFALFIPSLFLHRSLSPLGTLGAFLILGSAIMNETNSESPVEGYTP